MSTQDTQAQLLGGPSGDAVHIETDGRTIRPALNIVATLVDECKLTFDGQGLHIRAVDPTNVGLVDITVSADAFDDYEINADGGVTVGVHLDGVTTKLTNARLGKRTNDPVELDIDDTRTLIRIRREYDTTDVEYADEQLNIDPDSIREKPDIPELDLDGVATVDTDAVCDGIEHIATSADYVVMTNRGGDLVFSAKAGDESPSIYNSAVRYDNVVEDGEGEMESMYSLDYVTDMVGAVKSAYVDTTTIRWGEEYPLFVSFEKTDADGETVYSGRYMLAPRVRS
jgi:proliferating cell nuclear antigen